jgi:hypothetical protein
MQIQIEMNSSPKGKNKMTKKFLEKFSSVVLQVKQGEIKRYDSWCTLDGVPHDVSIYWMSKDLVRVDFKTPKRKKSANRRLLANRPKTSADRQDRDGGGKRQEIWNASFVQGVTCD